MKKTYLIKSDRYNHVHKFVSVLGTDDYRLVPEEEWMPIYVTFKENSKDVFFIDTEGGPCIGEGWSNGEVLVTKITHLDNILLFKLKEI